MVPTLFGRPGRSVTAAEIGVDGDRWSAGGGHRDPGRRRRSRSRARRPSAGASSASSTVASVSAEAAMATPSPVPTTEDSSTERSMLVDRAFSFTNSMTTTTARATGISHCTIGSASSYQVMIGMRNASGISATRMGQPIHVERPAGGTGRLVDRGEVLGEQGRQAGGEPRPRSPSGWWRRPAAVVEGGAVARRGSAPGTHPARSPRICWPSPRRWRWCTCTSRHCGSRVMVEIR